MRGLKPYAVLLLVWSVGVVLMSNPCCGESGFPLIKWHMHVVNGLSAGRVLFAHCQSKDDDLGHHNLTTGSELSWTFRNNFWGTTLFWCYTRTGNQHATFKVFGLNLGLKLDATQTLAFGLPKMMGSTSKTFLLTMMSLFINGKMDGN